MNGNADIGDIVNKLAENPETLKKLMSVAGNLFANDTGVGTNERKQTEYYDRHEHKDTNECYECDRFNSEKRCNDSHTDNICEKNERRHHRNDAEDLIRLLIALKPYVSDDRCSKIDGVIKILKLIQLSEKTGLLKSLL